MSVRSQSARTWLAVACALAAGGLLWSLAGSDSGAAGDAAIPVADAVERVHTPTELVAPRDAAVDQSLPAVDAVPDARETVEARGPSARDRWFAGPAPIMGQLGGVGSRTLPYTEARLECAGIVEVVRSGASGRFATEQEFPAGDVRVTWLHHVEEQAVDATFEHRPRFPCTVELSGTPELAVLRFRGSDPPRGVVDVRLTASALTPGVVVIGNEVTLETEERTCRVRRVADRCWLAAPVAADGTYVEHWRWRGPELHVTAGGERWFPVASQHRSGGVRSSGVIDLYPFTLGSLVVHPTVAGSDARWHVLLELEPVRVPALETELARAIAAGLEPPGPDLAERQVLEDHVAQRFAPLLPGTYRVTAEGSGIEPFAQSVDLAPSEHAELDVTLRAATAGTELVLEWVLADPTRPAPDVQFKLLRADGTPAVLAETLACSGWEGLGDGKILRTAVAGLEPEEHRVWSRGTFPAPEGLCGHVFVSMATDRATPPGTVRGVLHNAELERVQVLTGGLGEIHAIEFVDRDGAARRRLQAPEADPFAVIHSGRTHGYRVTHVGALGQPEPVVAEGLVSDGTITMHPELGRVLVLRPRIR